MSILYLCDGKRCDGCTHKNGCYHTRDINYAVNFKDDGCGAFVEQPAMLEAKDSLTDLVKALTALTITWIERIPKVCQDSNDENVQRIVKIQKAIENVILTISKKIVYEESPCEVVSLPLSRTLEELFDKYKEAGNGKM